jgi:methionine aminotransferase
MVLDQDDLRELARVLQHTDAFVVSDEVYEHIVFDGVRHESMSRHPEIAERAVVISSFGKTYHTTGWKVGYCAAPPMLAGEVARVHQWVTYAVNTPIQHAYAEIVNRDPKCEAVTSFYQAKRDRFLALLEGSPFRPLPCGGTFFQVVDYSAITDEHDADFAIRLTREHGVAAIPISPFLSGVEPGPVLRFCFAKRDETLVAAAERLKALRVQGSGLRAQ